MGTIAQGSCTRVEQTALDGGKGAARTLQLLTEVVYVARRIVSRIQRGHHIWEVVGVLSLGAKTSAIRLAAWNMGKVTGVVLVLVLEREAHG